MHKELESSLEMLILNVEMSQAFHLVDVEVTRVYFTVILLYAQRLDRTGDMLKTEYRTIAIKF